MQQKLTVAVVVGFSSQCDGAFC